jgi:hypothetical protein
VEGLGEARRQHLLLLQLLLLQGVAQPRGHRLVMLEGHQLLHQLLLVWVVGRTAAAWRLPALLPSVSLRRAPCRASHQHSASSVCQAQALGHILPQTTPTQCCIRQLE